MYFSRKDAGVMRRMLDNWPSDDAEIVVASGGFDPAKSMPVCLDLGTNNEGLRAHDYYLGADEPRLQGEAHMAVVEEFCLAIKDKWPNCLIQFEDFRTEDAFRPARVDNASTVIRLHLAVGCTRVHACSMYNRSPQSRVSLVTSLHPRQSIESNQSRRRAPRLERSM